MLFQPEITDADMETQAAETGFEDDRPIWMQTNLLFGVLAQFAYVGSQVAVASFFINYVTEQKPDLPTYQASNYLSLGQSCFAIGRFVAVAFLKYLKPRYVLCIFVAGCVAFSAAAQKVSGDTSIGIACMILFFESCVFPTIFTIAITGLGRNTKRGASFVVASVSGGALFPFIMAKTADIHNSTRYAFCVPMAGFLSTFAYAVYINVFEKKRLDTFTNSEIGTKADPMVDNTTGRSKSVSYGASGEPGVLREKVEA